MVVEMFNPIIASMIRASGRSWWQARYANGKILSEWDTLTDKVRLPIGASNSSRWEEVPKKDMVGLRLLCPNGMAGELAAPEEFRFFQLKVGFLDVIIGGGSSRSTGAHIIGVVQDAEGNCLCRAWETKEKRLIEFRDNIHNMKYHNIGRLSLEPQGLRV